MLLLAAELLSINVCLGSAERELSLIGTINGVIVDKLYNTVRASAVAVSDAVLLCVRGPDTLIPRVDFAFAQDLNSSGHARLEELKIRRPHSTDGIRALACWFLR